MLLLPAEASEQDKTRSPPAAFMETFPNYFEQLKIFKFNHLKLSNELLGLKIKRNNGFY